MKLENRVVIVTGAASGIGAASARLFAAEGARVALVDLDEAGILDVAAEIEHRRLEQRRALPRRETPQNRRTRLDRPLRAVPRSLVVGESVEQFVIVHEAPLQARAALPR